MSPVFIGIFLDNFLRGSYNLIGLNSNYLHSNFIEVHFEARGSRYRSPVLMEKYSVMPACKMQFPIRECK